VEVLDYKALQMGRQLGQGAEGAVYEARYQDAPVAVKDSPSLNEIEMYMAVGVHDNVVGLRGLCQKVRAVCSCGGGRGCKDSCKATWEWLSAPTVCSMSMQRSKGQQVTAHAFGGAQ
jgi:hypothetical protein